MNPWEDEELRIAYLLGRISNEEREAVGDRLFADPAFAELMEESERGLLDQYARGALGVEDRAAVEAYLLASDRQKAKVRFAALMADRTDVQVRRRPALRNRWIVPLGAIAAILIAAAVIWVARSRIAPSGNLQSNPVAQVAPQARAGATASVEPPAIFAALLSPGGTRDGARQEVLLPAKTGVLRFDLELGPAAKAVNYPVRLLRGAQVVWSQEDVLPAVEAGQPILSLRVPATALAAGSYQFVIGWKNEESIYRFLVR
jgi:hypothetical protein